MNIKKLAHVIKCSRCNIPVIATIRHWQEVDGDINLLCPDCIEDIINNREHRPQCPICLNRRPRLVRHHWYSPPLYLLEYIYACDGCNQKLQARFMWNINGSSHRGQATWMNHILPNLKLQQLFITDKLQYCNQLYKEYIYPLPLPPIISKSKAYKCSGVQYFPVREILDGTPVLWYDPIEVGRNHMSYR